MVQCVYFAWQGKKFDEEKYISFIMNTEDLPIFKTFEFVGEALPQIILSIIFAANNFEFLLKYDTYLFSTVFLISY